MIEALLVVMRTSRILIPVLAAAAIAGACGGQAFSSNPNGNGGTNSSIGNDPGSGGNVGQSGSMNGASGSDPGTVVGNMDCSNAADCDDANPCTVDVCTSEDICQHFPIDGMCESDDDECTSDICSGGFCTHPANGICACEDDPECDDSNPCTDDECSSGNCVYDNNTDPCADDGNECTNDQCSAGSCMHDNNSAACADDADECTDDVCSSGACTHPANGMCQCSSPAQCNDNNPCTDDDCAAGECKYTNNTAPCLDDGNACTADVCQGGDCGHHLMGEPIPAKNTWVAAASSIPQVAIGGCPGDATEPPSQGIDGEAATRWTSGKFQTGGDWYQIDFGMPVTLNRIDLDSLGASMDNCMGSAADYPRQYEVRFSEAPIENNSSPPIAQGEGAAGHTFIQLQQPLTGRYLRITQTGIAEANWWSIHEVNVACQ